MYVLTPSTLTCTLTCTYECVHKCQLRVSATKEYMSNIFSFGNHMYMNRLVHDITWLLWLPGVSVHA